MTLKEYCIRNHIEEMLGQWDDKLNSGLSPEEIAFSSHRASWWRCNKGHVWQAQVKDRTRRHTGCPYCAGKIAIKGKTDLATLYPAVASEWHPVKNDNVRPEDVTPGTDRLYWWKCGSGHEWKASVENRALKGNKCPYCTGKKAWPGYNDLATEFPGLMKEWCFEYNKGIDPSRIRSHSAKRVFWKCSEGHVWESFVYNRTSKKRPGCPICAGKGKGSAKAKDLEEGRTPYVVCTSGGERKGMAETR